MNNSNVNSSYSNIRELFQTPVIDQNGKILSFFRTQQLNPVPMSRTAKIAKNHGRIVKSRIQQVTQISTKTSNLRAFYL